ncbi:MAG: carbohydrate kinase [Pseudomonadota bacterium]
MAKLWFLGEALIDFVPMESGSVPAFASHCGGSPFNSAKAARLAGADVGFLGPISTDFFGDRLYSDLVAHGIDTGSTPRPDAPSTLAFVELQDGQARYAFFNTGSAITQLAPTLGEFPGQPGDILGLGSVSLVAAPGADNIARYAASVADRATIALDPNARPGVTPDPEDWRARVRSLADLAGVVKISDEDLEFLVPGTSATDFATAQLARGTSLVVVTRGAEGAEAFTPGTHLLRTPPKVDVADTVGAGDTITGFLLNGLSERGVTDRGALRMLAEETVADVLETAMTAAAITCTRVGCVPPTAQEVAQFRTELGG